MGWTIEFSEAAIKQLKKLDKQTRLRIFDYLDSRVCSTEEPKQQGKALAYNKAGLWRYRIGDYRIICEINGEALTVFVLSIGHRKEVYR